MEPPTPTIREQLEKLKQDIEEERKKQDGSKTRLAQLEASRKRLEEQLKKIDAGLEEYSARYEILKGARDEADQRRERLVPPEVEAELARYEDQIKALIAEYVADLTKGARNAELAEENKVKAARKLETEQEKLEEAERVLAAWAEILRTVETDLKSLNKTLDAIAVDLRVGRPALAAYRLRFAQKVEASGKTDTSKAHTSTTDTSYAEVKKHADKFLGVAPDAFEGTVEPLMLKVKAAQDAKAEAEERLKEATAVSTAARKAWLDVVARRDREIEQRLALMELEPATGSAPKGAKTRGAQEPPETKAAG